MGRDWRAIGPKSRRNRVIATAFASDEVPLSPGS
jgi:hypothetical protein